MPRGDGRKYGETRIPRRQHLPQHIPKKLKTRIEWWENEFREGIAYTEKDKHDGRGNSYRRPGSQQ